MTHHQLPRWQRSVAAGIGIQFTVFSLLTLSVGSRPVAAQETEDDPAMQQVEPGQDAATAPEAAPSTPSPEQDGKAAWERAQGFLVAGEYDKAEAVLQTAVYNETDPAVLEPLWLKLIETHVLRANSFRRSGDAEIADHYYGKAKETIKECLGNPELASLRPDPDLVPDEMSRIFNETVREIFGFLEIRELVPPDATVLLDGVPVSVPPGAEFVRVENVPVGEREIAAEADGYQTKTERITITPNGTTGYRVNLKKKRGVFWYAGRGAVIAGAAVAAILVGGGGGQTAEEPLPGPPAPPN